MGTWEELLEINQRNDHIVVDNIKLPEGGRILKICPLDTSRFFSSTVPVDEGSILTAMCEARCEGEAPVIVVHELESQEYSQMYLQKSDR